MEHTVINIQQNGELCKNPCFVMKCEKCKRDIIQKYVLEHYCGHNACVECTKLYRYSCPVCSWQRSNSYLSYISNYISDLFYKNRVKKFVDDLPSSEQGSV